MKKNSLRLQQLSWFVAAFIGVTFAAHAQTWNSVGKGVTIPEATLNGVCNSAKDTVGITTDHTQLLTCQSNLWKKQTGGSGSSLTLSSTSPSTMYWQQAVNYCAALSENGQTGWRLPSYPELRSLISSSSVELWTADTTWNSYFNCNRMALTFDTSGSATTSNYGAGQCRDQLQLYARCVR